MTSLASIISAQPTAEEKVKAAKSFDSWEYINQRRFRVFSLVGGYLSLLKRGFPLPIFSSPRIHNHHSSSLRFLLKLSINLSLSPLRYYSSVFKFYTSGRITTSLDLFNRWIYILFNVQLMLPKYISWLLNPNIDVVRLIVSFPIPIILSSLIMTLVFKECILSSTTIAISMSW